MEWVLCGGGCGVKNLRGIVFYLTELTLNMAAILLVFTVA